MEIAAVHAIAGLAEEEQNEVVAAAYGAYDVAFGAQYLIPKPFDPRLIVRIAPAVAKAAMDGGVAKRLLTDLDAYVEQLQQFVYHSGAFMKPLFATARRLVRDGGKARIVFTEGEDERVLRAVQVIVDESWRGRSRSGALRCCWRASSDSACGSGSAGCRGDESRV